MKKVLFIIVALALIVPSATYAFSFSDLFWWRNTEEIKEVKKDLTPDQQIRAESKLAVWLSAYQENDLSLLANNSRYTNISEAEINFMLAEQLADYDNPPIKDVKVDLIENKIVIDGYAMIPLRGKAHMEVRIEVLDDQLYFHVSRARYKGFPIPGAFVGRLIYKYMGEPAEFLFKDPLMKLREVSIQGDLLTITIN